MTPDDQWITKQEAGARLGVSGRRIHDLAKFGQLKSTQVRDPDTGHMAIRIHAGSLERFIFERDNPSNEEPKQEVRVSRGSRGTHELIDQFIMRMTQAALSAPSARLWLTVTESASYSGLPVTILLHLVREGKLAAMDVGRRRGGRWRIRRVDLDCFAG